MGRHRKPPSGFVLKYELQYLYWLWRAVIRPTSRHHARRYRAKLVQQLNKTNKIK